ncbi:hypothetical protein RJ641_011055 [Dillenia turbinata]|uniref:Xaa-Pro aminopeptidase P n=1 Tax=Dillenia turbinata TaxID=194707 RepID=A0AAN8V3P5_9MAGN
MGATFCTPRRSLSDQWKLMRYGEDPPVETWMANNLPQDAAVGVDPWCITVDTAHRWEHAFPKKQELVKTSTNLVDEFAGRSVADKLKDLREELRQEKACGIIITALDGVAWLYNVRGSDVSYSPVVHAFAIVISDSAFFYVDKIKISSEVNSHMDENKFEIQEFDVVGSDVTLFSSNQLNSSSMCGINGNGANEVDGENHNFKWADPAVTLALAKALKNPVELEGLKNSHIRDGVAVVQYLVWLDKQIASVPQIFYNLDGRGTMKPSEVTASDKLESFRASKEHFKGLSFPTISSVGPNVAIVHYSPEAETCSEMDPDSIYLFDSGAQCQDGTTDITRPVHFGKPSAHEKACYTADGLDYRHGIGHGVGSYLYVHKGPHQISFRPLARTVPLQASVTVTDEPGYYEDGNFGIRLENVLIIKEAETKFIFGDKGYLSFEHITWDVVSIIAFDAFYHARAPYQIKLINLSLSTPEEIQWVNSYHSNCREILAPYLDESEMAWLKKATEPMTA